MLTLKSVFHSSALLALSSFSSLSVWAQQTDNAEQQLAGDIAIQAKAFPTCLANLEVTATEVGLSDDIIASALSTASFDPRVIKYDRRQPEFIETFPDYLTKRVTKWRVNKGRELLSKHKDFLAQLTAEYGIPGHYLVAFWGLETNYGTYKGKMPIIDSLATLACDQRRSAFFTEQLMLALQLMEREQLSLDTMLGSWAGAMGHTQFMPSAYLQYAIDGDNDGRANLWHSERDALASAANFLRGLGWQPGFRWGREIMLTTDFDYATAGRSNAQPLANWSQRGITRTDGKAVGSAELDASVLIPAGASGPAFLVYPNFDVIMRWNNSEFYAIAVGHLADRIIGGAKLAAALPELPTYSVAQMKKLQDSLNKRGFDVGEADGIMGPATRKGIRQFQASQDMVADGFPDAKVFDALVQSQG